MSTEQPRRHTCLVHSVQLWETVTGRKSRYSVKHVDSSHRLSEREVEFLQQMEKTIRDYNPEAHGYKYVGRAKFIGDFWEADCLEGKK